MNPRQIKNKLNFNTNPEILTITPSLPIISQQFSSQSLIKKENSNEYIQKLFMELKSIN